MAERKVSMLEAASKIQSVKALEKKEKRKNKILNEIVHVSFPSPDGTIDPKRIWKITRRKLTESYINELMQTTGSKMDYLYDQNNVIIWPHEMNIKCNLLPVEYKVAPRIFIDSQDCLIDGNYSGTTSIILQNVPMCNATGTDQVTEAAMTAWVRFAMDEEDDGAYQARALIDTKKKKLVAIQKKIEHISHIEFKDDQGKDIASVNAERKREDMYNQIISEKEEIDKALAEADLQLSQAISKRSLLTLHVSKLFISSEQAKLCTWMVDVFGPESVEISNRLVIKKDWSGIKLAMKLEAVVVHKEEEEDDEDDNQKKEKKKKIDNHPPYWVGRGALPIGEKNYEFDYTPGLVTMVAVRLSRVEHGIGSMFRFDYIYYGQYQYGKRDGYGIEISESDVYVGNFSNDVRCGTGRSLLMNGDEWNGRWTRTISITNTVTGSTITDDVNPYKTSELSGNVNLNFSDGGNYSGQVSDFCHEWNGTYTSSTGDIMNGKWTNGLLNGHCTCQSQYRSDEGNYISGSLNGKGFVSFKPPHANQVEYEGYMMDGLMNGLGELTVHDNNDKDNERNEKKKKKKKKKKNCTSYEGYFLNNFKHGRGYYDHNDKWKYEGQMVSSSVLNRGAIHAMETNTASLLSCHNLSLYEPLAQMRNRDKRLIQSVVAAERRSQAIESGMRRLMEHDKTVIFRQQCKWAHEAVEKHSNVDETDREAVDFEGRRLARESSTYRLAKSFPVNPIHAQVSSLHVEPKEITVLRDAMEKIRLIAVSKGIVMEPPSLLLKIVMSDMEAMEERQRAFMYDRAFEKIEKKWNRGKLV